MCSAPFSCKRAMSFTPRTIAIIRTDRLGDMVLTLPMFPALRSLFPSARLMLIAARYVEPLVRDLRCIDEVVYLDAQTDNLQTILRRHGVDVVFAPRPRASEAWAAVRSGVNLRIGSAYRWYAPLYNRRIREHRADAQFHEAEYNVRMIMHAFGCPMPQVELVSPRENRIRHGQPAAPRVIIHPGSGGSAKDWPAKRFGELANRLRQHHNAEILVTGIDRERALCEEVLRACPEGTNLCGTRDLESMIDLIATSDLLVANSTGVLHVAASLGVAVLGLFPTTPSMSARRWGPYTRRAIVLESGPGDDMMSITVDAAAAAAASLLTAP